MPRPAQLEARAEEFRRGTIVTQIALSRRRQDAGVGERRRRRAALGPADAHMSPRLAGAGRLAAWPSPFLPMRSSWSTGYADRTVRVWKCADGTTAPTAACGTLCTTSVFFRRGEGVLAADGGGTIRMWKLSASTLDPRPTTISGGLLLDLERPIRRQHCPLEAPCRGHSSHLPSIAPATRWRRPEMTER